MSDYQLNIFGEDTQAAARPVTLKLSKTISADQQRVFDQWLIPVFIGNWMFGAHLGKEQVMELENTVRKDGGFSYRIQRDGKAMEIHGSFVELRIPDRLVMSWVESDRPKLESRISVQFEAQDGKTRMQLSLRLPPELSPEQEAIKSQWTERLNALAARLK